MGIVNIYDWGLPNQAEHLARYRDNEARYKAAIDLWKDIDTSSIYFLSAALIISTLIVWFYYCGYNNRPGRKYRICHWAIWLAITAVVTIILTMIIGNVTVSSTLNEQVGFILRISLINGLYASCFYFLWSFIICNVPVTTNAYRFLKIDK